MYLSEICIKRPIGTCLVMLALLFFGGYGYYLLPISQLPDVYFPTIVVSASLPGASPETMSTAVATPLEKRFATISGINTITSKSSLGITQITLQFDFAKNIDAAALDVQSAINASSGDLPSNMLYPPVYVRINPAEAPVLYLSMYSDSLPLYVVDDYAERLFAQRLSMVNGVSQVSIYGSQKYATRVQLDPSKLSAYKIPFLEVKQAVSQANVNLSTGSLSSKAQELPIKLNSQIDQISEYQNIIIAFRNGEPVKLHQVGHAIPSVENTKVASWNNDQRSIILFVQRQPGTNTLEVVQRVHKEIAILKKQLPANINIVPVYDRSPTIRSSVQDVEHTLIISISLVVIVIFFFLRNLKAALIISTVLPLSIIGTFAFMKLLGYSLNIISLLALTLVVGFVVDDAIVVLENISRYLEQGKEKLTAALLGVKEISFTVITITLSLIIVFIPVLFIGGIIGKLFREFAVTSAVTILLSGFISLTLTPMLASKFLSHDHNLSNNRMFELSERFNNWFLNNYKRTLNLALNKKQYILSIFFLTIVCSLLLFKFIAKGFIPDQDIGNLICFTEADPDIGFDLMVNKQKQISDLIRKHNDVESVIYNVGAGGFSQTMNAGSIIVKLKPYANRKYTVKQIINQLRSKVNTVPGIRVYLQNFQVIPISAKMNKGVYQYVVLDPDLKKLQQVVELLQKNLENLPELQDVTNDLQITTPQLMINIDRNKAGSLGVNMQDIANTLYAAFGTSQISNVYTRSDTYKVILEILPQYNNKTFLQNLEVRSNNGNLVPLNSIATFKFKNELLTINHQGQVPAATISFNVPAGKSLSQALNAIEARVKKLSLPESIVMQFSGAAETFKSSIQNLIILLFIVGLVIYILLGILYESFIHPITVLSGLPAAFFGALFTLFVFNLDLDLYGFIGLIILMGIVKKNAIMMIDFALEQQRNLNLPPEQAIYNACLIRFRPIMMTTMSAILGALPIALGIGSVAIDTQRSLGVAVVGGLIFSQILTLYITPVIYIYLSKLNKLLN